MTTLTEVNTTAAESSLLEVIEHRSLAPTMQHEDETDDDDASSVGSNDSCLDMIAFRSIRDGNGLEEAITFSWPGLKRTFRLSTLLEPDDLAPIFAGAQWAGTRVWHAAIRATEYLSQHYHEEISNRASLIELGCGLGVPGMIVHALGGDVVLTDQEEIMSQLCKNVACNFPDTSVGNAKPAELTRSNKIRAEALSWSRPGVRSLLHASGRERKGFDFVLNCDCVYEPLYGKSWNLLVEVMDELLLVNPSCVVLTSVERRNADGVGDFLDAMRLCDHVSGVEKVMEDAEHNIELYVARGYGKR